MISKESQSWNILKTVHFSRQKNVAHFNCETNLILRQTLGCTFEYLATTAILF